MGKYSSHFVRQTLSPTLAQNSALLPRAACTSVSPAFSAASSSSFWKLSSSSSFSAFSFSYSCSSQGKSNVPLPLRLATMLAVPLGLLELDIEVLRADPSPEAFRMPSAGCARYRYSGAILYSEMAFWSFCSDTCLVLCVDDGLVRVKMSWARERSGYLAYCGSEPIMTVLQKW